MRLNFGDRLTAAENRVDRAVIGLLSHAIDEIRVTANNFESSTMKHAGKILIVTVSLGCLTLLVLSVYPGLLVDLAMLAAFFSVCIGPVLLIAGFITVIVLDRRGAFSEFRMTWKQVGIAAAVFMATGVAIVFYLPRRVAFACSRSAFEALADQATESRVGGQPLDQWLGVFHVDRYAADPRGGVYFRVYQGGDGIGPDTLSSGFVHHPNRVGSPFGAARYATHPLGGGWYWFMASNDW